MEEETCRLKMTKEIYPLIATYGSHLDPDSKKQWFFFNCYIYETIEIYFKHWIIDVYHIKKLPF